VPVYGVASTGTYPDMHRRMRLVDEHKSGAIWRIYFLPATLMGVTYSTVSKIVSTFGSRIKTEKELGAIFEMLNSQFKV
jgi:hypothetical protein